MGPAHTSGGSMPVWRATATVDPSRENAAEVPQRAVRCSGPRQSVAGVPGRSGSTRRKAVSPPMSAVATSPASRVHTSWAAEARIPGVTFRARAPVTGTTRTSPPFAPKSLISPSMNATRVPSGLQVGSQSWSAGWWSTRAGPPAVGTMNSSAVHQLSSPEPCAPVAAKAVPSGLQAYS